MVDQPRHDRTGARDDAAPAGLLGSVPTQRASRLAAFTFSRGRVLIVAALVVLGVVGCALPYLSMPYVNFSAELDRFHASLFPAAQFVRGIEPLWLPNYQRGPATEHIGAALNVFNLGPNLQEFGIIIAVLTCASLFQDEINKFFWWPLHLSGWMLTLGPVALFVGQHLLSGSQVSVDLEIGWVPLALAGVLVLVATFRARGRIDTYQGI